MRPLPAIRGSEMLVPLYKTNSSSLNPALIKQDGLSDLKYTEHGKTYDNKITHVNIGI